MLGKLHIPDEVDEDKIRTLKLLVNNLQRVRTATLWDRQFFSYDGWQRRRLKDATTKSALMRFDKALTKRFVDQLEGFNEEEFRQLEDLKDMFEFLDEIISDDEESNELLPLPKRGAARSIVVVPSVIARKCTEPCAIIHRSQSTSTNVTLDGEDFEYSTPAPKGRSSRRCVGHPES